MDITTIKRLEPYLKIAQQEAHKSECIRRQYGAVVATEMPDANGQPVWYFTGYNQRVARCCQGKFCARDRLDIRPGRCVEVGGEIHAEIAALINSGNYQKGNKFILVGFSRGVPVLDKNSYPCHACAMALKFAGYRYIYLLNELETLAPYSVERIIEEREREWIPVE